MPLKYETWSTGTKGMSLAEQKARKNGIGTSDKYSTRAPAGYIRVSEGIMCDFETWRCLK